MPQTTQKCVLCLLPVCDVEVPLEPDPDPDPREPDPDALDPVPDLASSCRSKSSSSLDVDCASWFPESLGLSPWKKQQMNSQTFCVALLPTWMQIISTKYSSNVRTICRGLTLLKVNTDIYSSHLIDMLIKEALTVVVPRAALSVVRLWQLFLQQIQL